MDDLMQGFAEFIRACPSSFHAAAEIAAMLRAADFVELDEREPFPSAAGGYYFIRDGACMAWRIPQQADSRRGFRIVGSHTDSPSFTLKPRPQHDCAGWQQCGMEVYGGPLLTSWLNRDLGLAGRLTTKSGAVRLVSTGPIMVIPQLAPHLDRNPVVDLDRQAHLMPIYSFDRPDFDVVDYLCDQAEITRDDLGFFTIHATDTQPPAAVGVHQEFFAAWRMDNLSSVYASLQALLQHQTCDDIQVLAAFDHEEVGSSTRSGAAGPILEDTLRRIACSLGADEQGFRQMISQSSCISADAAHAVNPNYVGKHDPDTHPAFNAGPVLKINGNQRYATDAVGGALWYRACAQAGVPTQEFVGNNAVPCGSTIGPLTATRLGILTVDVGIPLLSMHSARELCGSDDMAYLTKALSAYYAGA